MSKSFTIVTSLIDIDRDSWENKFRRGFDLYLYYMSKYLVMDCYFYIFIDSKKVDELLTMLATETSGDLTKIKIVHININDLLMYKYKDRITQIMSDKSRLDKIDANKSSPEFNIPDYNIVVNSKVDLMYRASSDNPFNTDYFIWLDGGYGHGRATIPEKWNPNNILVEDKISVLCLMPPYNISEDRVEFFNKHIDVVNGGMFSGKKETIKKYYELFYKELDEYTEQGITDDDQYSVSMVLKKNPDLFNVIINSNWYCAFEI